MSGIAAGASLYLLALQRYHILPFYSLLTTEAAKYVKVDGASLVRGHLLHR